jgi:hypothetical protein
MYVSSSNLFNEPDADVILRSCDPQDSRVLRLYIIKSSPVLRGLMEATTIKDLKDKFDVMTGCPLYELWKFHPAARGHLASDLNVFSILYLLPVGLIATLKP